MTMRLPPMKWAQRSDSIYLTIALPDAKVHKLDLQDKTLEFHATAQDNEYKCKLEFFKEIDAEDSKYDVKPRSIHFHIMKKNKDEEYWPRLLNDKQLEKTHISIDWDRFADEDEEQEAGGFDTTGMGGMPGGMGGMPGGMGGMGGMDLQSMLGGMGGGAMGGAGAGGMDLSSMLGGMGGAGMEGMGDMGDLGGEGDSDDEADDLPDLEEEEQTAQAETSAEKSESA